MLSIYTSLTVEANAPPLESLHREGLLQAVVLPALGEEPGLRLFRRLVAQNGVSVRKGHVLLTNLVASGAVPLALGVYNFTAGQITP